MPLGLDRQGVAEEQKIDSILRCYDDGIRHFINKVQDKTITVFLGRLKSGKSTVVSGLCGDEMESYKEVGEPVYIRKIGHGKGPDIGSEGIAACTLRPNVYEIAGLGLVVDMPGFDDNRIDKHQDVINAMFIREVLLVAGRIRLAIVVDYDGLVQPDAARFIDTMEALCNMIPVIKDVQTQSKITPGLFTIFTCCPSDVVDSIVIVNKITTKILNGNLTVPLGAKAMSEIIIQHSDKISVFNRPDVAKQKIDKIGNVLEILGKKGDDQYIEAQALGEIHIPLALKSETVLCDLYEKISIMMTKIIKGMAYVYDDVIKQEDMDDMSSEIQQIRHSISACKQAGETVGWVDMIRALVPEEVSVRIAEKHRIVQFFDETALPGKTKMSNALQVQIKAVAQVIEYKINKKELVKYGEELSFNEQKLTTIRVVQQNSQSTIQKLQKILNPQDIGDRLFLAYDTLEAGWDGVVDAASTVVCKHKENISLIAPGGGVGGALIMIVVSHAVLPVIAGLVVGGGVGVSVCGLRKIFIRKKEIEEQLLEQESDLIKTDQKLFNIKTTLSQVVNRICGQLNVELHIPEDNNYVHIHNILNQQIGKYDANIELHDIELKGLSGSILYNDAAWEPF